jgi:hypothetical protein
MKVSIDGLYAELTSLRAHLSELIERTPTTAKRKGATVLFIEYDVGDNGMIGSWDSSMPLRKRRGPARRRLDELAPVLR